MILSTPAYLAESLLQNLVTGDVEDEINSIEKESHDIHTPEQQRIVITKTVTLLEKLIRMRHSPTATERFAHNLVPKLQKMLGSSNPARELDSRMSEAIARLSKIRDSILNKKWASDASNERLEQMKKDISEKLKEAEKGAE